MLFVFGEERFAGKIAEAICKAREDHRITRTLDLVDIIRSAVPAGYEKGRIHPATRTFQALRIAVNDEVQALKQAIDEAHEVLAPGGRLAIITFHSIEDRIVKLAFQDARWDAMQKRPLVATEEELAHNPRARSAKLRSAIKQVI
jgi:16S rRNA (cytosine1402-N4)-methyltransferase